MKKHYVSAVLELLKNEDASVVLTGLKDTLESKGHMSLYASILRAVLTQLEARDVSQLPQVTIASEEALKNQKTAIDAALKEIDAPAEFDTVVDESIIGGSVVSYNNVLLDQSYKSALTKLYRSITK
ncbi:MAG: F0F1-type ATP synthase delta subunit [Candidatus Azotimanducaceae bacterium]|jgi:F0F1-type ATP synthase delta subunit